MEEKILNLEYKLVGTLNKLDVIPELVYPVFENEGQYFLQSPSNPLKIETFDFLFNELSVLFIHVADRNITDHTDSGENTVSGLIRSAKQKRYEHPAATGSKAVLIKPKTPPADSEGEAPETIRARLDLMSFTESQQREKY